jgi:DNA-binding CsgD family transcriptional regulator
VSPGAVSEAPLSRLFERDRELVAVSELLELAEVGSGQVLLVLGPAGIGKTGLLAATSRMGRAAGCRVLEAVAGELERDLGWGVVRQLFAGLVRSGSQLDRDLFAGAAELALPVLGVGRAAPGVDALSPALHGLYWLTANLSERAPAVLVVDDSQWADPASARFLYYLASRVADLPVLLVLAIRSDDHAAHEREAALRAVADALVLEPAPLSVKAAQRMLAAALGRHPEPEFAAACHAATGGNPFLLSELGAQLAADGIEPTAGATWQVQQVSPRAVSNWVLLRLSRLPTGAPRLAEAVAVLGGRAQLAAAAALADLDAAAATALADGLFAAGVLQAGAPLDFVHPLVRAAVYGEIAPLARNAAHAHAARLLTDAGAERDRAAAQLLQTHPAGDPWVVETLLGAAAWARDRGAPEAAVVWLRRALAEPPHPELRASVMFQLGLAEAEGSDAALAVEHLQQAHGLASDPVERGRIALALAWGLLATNQVREAFELARCARSELAGRDRELELHLLAFATNAPWLDSSFAGVETPLPALPSCPTGDTRGERLFLVSLAASTILSGDQPAAQATARLQRALADDRFVGDWGSEDPQFWQGIYALHVADELDLAERLERQALDAARKRGLIPGLCIAATFHAALYLQRGWLRQAEAEVDCAIQFGAGAWPLGQSFMIHIRVQTLADQGRLAQAETETARVDSIDALPTSVTYLHSVLSRGCLRVAQGRFEEGLADLLHVGRYSSTPNPAVFPWRSHAAPALAALGRREEARELLAQELKLARAFGVARPIGVNRRAAGVLEGGEAGIALLRESVQVLERCPSVLERAHSLVELGSALRRRGRRTDSLPSLRHGLELADRAGAITLVQRARRELADAGARPHRSPRLARDTLTPSEARIAQMAAEGATNKQIAQGLFVSLRTVETHLTHTYAKLGITARAKLAPALAATTDQPIWSGASSSPP